LALILDQLLRAAGHTLDVTLRPEWLVGQAIVSLGLCLLAAGLYRRRRVGEPDTHTRVGLLHGLAWGGWLFLETALLAFPNALARWSDTPYAAVAPLLLGVTLLMLLEGGHWTARWGRRGRMISAAVLLAGLAGGYLLTGPVALACLLLAQISALSLLPVCFPPPREDQEDRSGRALAAGGAVYMILNFAYAFAFTYAYTLDLFRDAGLPLFLIAGLLVSLPALRRPVQAEAPTRLVAGRWLVLLGVALVAVVAVLAWPAAPRPAAAKNELRPATYNIHYGYDTHWHLSLEVQAQTIEASGADVVALQEVDTGRPTSYMVDNALWLSRRLGMEVVYLPCVEYLTGIALLSRYPVLASEGVLLPSELEQTGIIWAELDLGDRPVNAFAIWMGLEPDERARQLNAALPFLDAHPGPAVWGGDFNSTPDSPVYARIAGAGFVDPFPTLALGSPPTSPAINPLKRIDFVWLRGLKSVDAQVAGSTASDHRMVIVEASLP
jgi:endonuclease/exonuclease/phosphatase family metal-dependent hydrolase